MLVFLLLKREVCHYLKKQDLNKLCNFLIMDFFNVYIMDDYIIYDYNTNTTITYNIQRMINMLEYKQ